MRHRIPQELRVLPQWVCAGPDKIPLNPNNGLRASPTDSRTWGTFEAAVASGMKNIGFVLTREDPYCIIDLDVKDDTSPADLDRHQRIMQAFDSYTERSASGRGVHIIVRARVPAGARRDSVEIYSSERYMICTGDVLKDLPIVDYNDYANQLFDEMQSGRTSHADLIELDEQRTDIEIFEMAMHAENGEKFSKLSSGDWQRDYPSQSEADFALLAILAFYTKSNEQVRRMFRMSALGKREKAMRNDDYLNRALSKIRAHELPPVDLSRLQLAAPVAAQETEPEPEPVKVPVTPLTFPPGLVGEIAEYIYSTAVRPVPEVALAAALSLVAGICGRSYNISGTGLNLYIILLAGTGTGKEGASRGIDNLLSAVKSTVPASDMFIGPSAFASGQALVRVLNDRPCFVSVLGEFGLTLKEMCDPRASSALVILKKVLLDIFTKSGSTQVLRPSVYSDTEKNTKTIEAPNVTILGESTPETFFNGLDETHISEGLIPRFCIIQYTGPRPPRNKDALRPPNPILVNKFTDLLNIALTTYANKACAHVQMTKEATALMDAFDARCDDFINSTGSDVEHQLWNRAHLKALKLAAVVAVGCEPYAPVVNERVAQWAIRFVENDVASILAKFSKGDVGRGETRHESDIRRAIESYLKMPSAQRAQYKVPKTLLEANAVPFHFLRRRLRLLASFRDDPRGAARAIQESLNDMVKAEILVMLPPAAAQQQFGVRSEIYAMGPTW